jgi:N-acetylglutamate synthase-like GNAT family acetyltransferase
MVRFANMEDIEDILSLDKHVERKMLADKILRNEILVSSEGGTFIGTLRYSLFWDSVPFMNLLYIKTEFQRKGYGTELVTHWENTMKQQGFKALMTSTMANEGAQHFYRKIGYRDIGGFVLPQEPMELMFYKEM